jgi:hypothetical protein
MTLTTSGYAQFQAPTDEELKMTAEPKAPGASAIYLYREETVDDALHFHSFYARIKVLSEKGKELATVTIPYVKGRSSITDVKARTIHADGKIIPLDVKPSDLVEQKGAGYQVNQVVFTLPSAEVGSILEYRWQMRYPDDDLSSPDWEISQPYYVRKAHFWFVPFPHLDQVTDSRGNAATHLMHSYILPQGVELNQEVTGKYNLDVSDIPAIPDEEFMPPVRAWMLRVKFYYTPYVSKEDFWKHEGDRWSKSVNGFANESKGLKEAVAHIVAPGDSEEQKAHKLYDAVMALENTNYTRRKSQAELKEQHQKEVKNAEDVWNQKSGSSDQIARLYLAMSRIAGLKAYALLVCNRNNEVFNPNYLSMEQFDDELVTVTIDGKAIPVDPGARFSPFGQLDWRHTIAAGLHQSDKGVVFSETSAIPYQGAVILRTGDVIVSPDGSVKGTLRVSMSGPESTRWRERAIENDEDEVKKQFTEKMQKEVPDGVTAEFDHFLGLEDYHSPLMAVVNISGNMGTVTGKRVFLPGVFFESRTKHPFVAEDKRQTAVDMKYGEIIRDQITYHLPNNFSIESAPAETSIPWEGRAVFQLKSKADKADVTVARNFIRGFAVVEPKDYTGLRDFYQRITTADQQQLVLTVGTTATPAASPTPAKTGRE